MVSLAKIQKNYLIRLEFQLNLKNLPMVNFVKLSKIDKKSIYHDFEFFVKI